MKFEPMAHQSRAWGVVLPVNPRYLLHWDMGTGKTLTTLRWAELKPMPTVLLAPISTHRSAWYNDVVQTPGVNLRHAAGPNRDRVIRAPESNTVTVTSHESFRRDVDLYIKAGYKRLVIDEADKVRGQIGKPNQIVEACAKLADKCESVLLLSGSIAPNGTYENFWPYRIMDPTVFGRNPWAFYERYFYPVRKKINGRDVVTAFRLRPDRQAEYVEKLLSRAWVIRKEDVMDLPQEIDIVREIPMNRETLKVYRAAYKTLSVEAQSGELKRFKAGASLTKIRQIAGGNVLLEGISNHVHSQKLRWLIDDFIGGEYGSKKPLVIWYEFTANGKAIYEALCELVGPEKVAWVHGGTSKNTGAVVEGFVAGRIQYIVAHPATMGHGTNGLQKVCSCAVYMELSFSYSQHAQSRARIHRLGMGKERPMFVYPLLTIETGEGGVMDSEREEVGNSESRDDDITIDQTMLYVVRRKGSANKLILETMKVLGDLKEMEEGGEKMDVEVLTASLPE